MKKIAMNTIVFFIAVLIKYNESGGSGKNDRKFPLYL